MARTRASLRIGLGLLVGAVLPIAVHAQVPDTSRARRDSTRRDSVRVTVPAPPQGDSLLRRDSLARKDTLPKRPPRDTIQPPVARAEAPLLSGIGGTYQWNRAALFASGARSVADLLERIPGVTAYRGGYIQAPAFASYLGQLSHVRIFLDGLELDALDSRDPAVIDLSQVQLWGLEELRIERGASELRVYMRSWRVDRTTPYTRVDASTGDQQMNLYRGFFGKRYGGGEAMQLGIQQYSTTPDRGSSSDALSILGRVGVARHGWSVDAFAVRSSRHRGDILGYPSLDTIPGLESSRTDAYLRAAVGDPESGPWIQALAGAQRYKMTGDSLPRLSGDTTTRPPRDTTLTQAQYVLTGGVTLGPLRVSGTGRYRVGGGHTLLTPSARAGIGFGRLAVTGFFEGKGPDSVSRADVMATVTPLPFIAFSGAVGRATDSRFGPSLTTTYARGEAGLRLAGLWFIGGVIRRDTAYLAPPTLLDTVYAFRREPSAIGMTAAIRGRIWKDLKADLSAVRWNDSTGSYRPQYSTRSEIYLETDWLRRFPSGNFGLLASGVHEYRSNTWFPTTTGAVVVPGYRVITARLEIRILSAVAFYEFANMMGQQYTQVPGFLRPRQTQTYGVRWEFWN